MKAVGLDPEKPEASASAVPRPTEPAGEPTDFRIAANAPIVGDARRFTEFTFTPADDKKTLVVTDLILQNPRSDSGTVQILRDAERHQERPAGGGTWQLPGPRPPLAAGVAVQAWREDRVGGQLPEPP